jgi:hypothetical protein
MPIVTCSHCGAQLDAPAELLGQMVTCSQCRQVFVAAAPGMAQAAPLPGALGMAPAPAPGVAPASGGGPIPPSPYPPPPQPPPYGPQPPLAAPLPGPGHYPVRQEKNGMAVVCLVLGICSLAMCGPVGLVCSILALIFHQSAQRDIAAGLAGPSAPGMAKAGMICGTIGIVLSLLGCAGMIAWISFLSHASVHHFGPPPQRWP